jgi:hypothetical protein
MPGQDYKLRLFAAAVAFGLGGAVAACGTVSDAAPVASAGTVTCPTTHTEEPAPHGVRRGDLIPRAPLSATLCVYPFASQAETDTFRLGRSAQLSSRDLNRLVTYLNGLAVVDPAEAQGCVLIGHDQYHLVLGYPNDTSALVRIDYNCATASYAGAVRRLNDMTTLLNFWA